MEKQERFGARISWILAGMVAFFAAMTFTPTTASAQSAPELCHRAQFAAFFAAAVEGVTPDRLAACVSRGECPANRLFRSWANAPRRLRDLRLIDSHLRTNVTRSALVTPGAMARANPQALRATCFGTVVRLDRVAMSRHPWQPGQWFPRACAGGKAIAVRTHRPLTALTRIVREDVSVAQAAERIANPVTQAAEVRDLATSAAATLAANDVEVAPRDLRAYGTALSRRVAAIPVTTPQTAVRGGTVTARGPPVVGTARLPSPDQAELNDLRKERDERRNDGFWFGIIIVVLLIFLFATGYGLYIVVNRPGVKLTDEELDQLHGDAYTSGFTAGVDQGVAQGRGEAEGRLGANARQSIDSMSDGYERRIDKLEKERESEAAKYAALLHAEQDHRIADEATFNTIFTNANAAAAKSDRTLDALASAILSALPAGDPRRAGVMDSYARAELAVGALSEMLSDRAFEERKRSTTKPGAAKPETSGEIQLKSLVEQRNSEIERLEGELKIARSLLSVALAEREMVAENLLAAEQLKLDLRHAAASEIAVKREEEIGIAHDEIIRTRTALVDLLGKLSPPKEKTDPFGRKAPSGEEGITDLASQLEHAVWSVFAGLVTQATPKRTADTGVFGEDVTVVTHQIHGQKPPSLKELVGQLSTAITKLVVKRPPPPPNPVVRQTLPVSPPVGTTVPLRSSTIPSFAAEGVPVEPAAPEITEWELEEVEEVEGGSYSSHHRNRR